MDGGLDFRFSFAGEPMAPGHLVSIPHFSTYQIKETRARCAPYAGCECNFTLVFDI